MKNAPARGQGRRLDESLGERSDVIAEVQAQREPASEPDPQAGASHCQKRSLVVRAQPGHSLERRLRILRSGDFVELGSYTRRSVWPDPFHRRSQEDEQVEVEGVRLALEVGADDSGAQKRVAVLVGVAELAGDPFATLCKERTDGESVPDAGLELARGSENGPSAIDAVAAGHTDFPALT